MNAKSIYINCMLMLSIQCDPTRGYIFYFSMKIGLER